MNLTFDRDAVAQFIILLAVCVGSWMMLVEPKLGEIAELREQITEASSSPTLDEEFITGLANRLRDIRARAAVIRRQNSFGEDSSRIYAQVTGLADEHGVVLRSLNPGRTKAGNDGGAEETVQALSFDMVIQGDYEHIGAFLAAVESMEGFIRPTALGLSPTQRDGRNTVEARIGCEALRFTLPEELVALTGGD